MINGRIAAVQEIERMVAQLALTRAERGDLIASVAPGERTLVKLNGHELAAVRDLLREWIGDRAAEGAAA
ncbi:MAG: hypothetical protein OXH04_19390 [Acidobacteria bacterium]|nr:hypothetical protein [Acidobacteriota bacterium]